MAVPQPREVEPISADDSEPNNGGKAGALQYRLAVVRHYRCVYAYAAAILGAGADAEDVTQEAFLRYGERGAGVRKPKEWLLRVVRNLSFDRFRMDSRLLVLETDGFAGTNGREALATDARDGPSMQAERADAARRLDRCIAALPEPQRSLILLFDVQGMTGDECARILELSSSQVKVYLHRARRRLREKMAGSYE